MREQSAGRNWLRLPGYRDAPRPCPPVLQERGVGSAGPSRPHSLSVGITVFLPRLVPFIDSAALGAGVTVGQRLFSPRPLLLFSPGLCLCSSVTPRPARGAAARPLNGRRSARGRGAGRRRPGGLGGRQGGRLSAPPAPAGASRPQGEQEMRGLELHPRHSAWVQVLGSQMH